MPITARPKKRNAEVLDVAAEVFAQKGYHGASTKDIADGLGIQQAGIYHYFKSKDAALAEVCRIGVAGFLDNLHDISVSDLAADEKIKQAIVEHLKPFRERRQYNQVFLNERRYLVGENRNQVARLARKYERGLQALFEHGVNQGTFRRDLDCRLATLALLGMCNAVPSWYGGKSAGDINAIADAYADIFLRGVTA